MEAARVSRVKELEVMVLKLKEENKQLLNKVSVNAEHYQEEAAFAKDGKRKKSLKQAQSVDDLISLDGETAGEEDEW